MTALITPPIALQKFFRSGAAPCPYLPGRMERKLFTRLAGGDAAAVNGLLTEAGFRRSHDIVYRPVCQGCMACVPVRVAVKGFKPGRSMRKLLKLAEGMTLTRQPAQPTQEQYRLFMHYQYSRHGDGDMARMGLADYAAMVREGQADTHMLELRDAGGRLMGAMIADRLEDGWSAVYSFFDTVEPARSLGTVLILRLIEMARAEGRSHVYLGYWVNGSRKMEYKARFQPLERLGPEGWVPLILSPGSTAE